MYTSTKEPYLQQIHDSLLERYQVQLKILRLDIIHPGVSGNKWYKLKYNLEEARLSGKDTVLTFGGAYSNHIHAMAIAAASTGLKSIGVIRGEGINPLNPTLEDAKQQGMRLHFISRTKYKDKNQEFFLDHLKEQFGDFYLVPEGGTNNLAIKGASEIPGVIKDKFDYIITPVGTGGTISGIIAGLKDKCVAIGISILKGYFLKKEIERLVIGYMGNKLENWTILNNYHFGGYAKFTKELVEFINQFREAHGVALDPVYTGKMMCGIYDLIEKGYFEPGSKIIAVHTGGLQGIRGFNERFGNIIQTGH